MIKTDLYIREKIRELVEKANNLDGVSVTKDCHNRDVFTFPSGEVITFTSYGKSLKGEVTLRGLPPYSKIQKAEDLECYSFSLSEVGGLSFHKIDTANKVWRTFKRMFKPQDSLSFDKSEPEKVRLRESPFVMEKIQAKAREDFSLASKKTEYNAQTTYSNSRYRIDVEERKFEVLNPSLERIRGAIKNSGGQPTKFGSFEVSDNITSMATKILDAPLSKGEEVINGLLDSRQTHIEDAHGSQRPISTTFSNIKKQEIYQTTVRIYDENGQILDIHNESKVLQEDLVGTKELFIMKNDKETLLHDGEFSPKEVFDEKQSQKIVEERLKKVDLDRRKKEFPKHCLQMLLAATLASAGKTLGNIDQFRDEKGKLNYIEMMKQFAIQTVMGTFCGLAAEKLALALEEYFDARPSLAAGGGTFFAVFALRNVSRILGGEKLSLDSILSDAGNSAMCGILSGLTRYLSGYWTPAIIIGPIFQGVYAYSTLTEKEKNDKNIKIDLAIDVGVGVLSSASFLLGPEVGFPAMVGLAYGGERLKKHLRKNNE